MIRRIGRLLLVLVAIVGCGAQLPQPSPDPVTNQVKTYLSASFPYLGDYARRFDHDNSELCTYDEFVFILQTSDRDTTDQVVIDALMQHGWNPPPMSSSPRPSALLKDDTYLLTLTTNTLLYEDTYLYDQDRSHLEAVPDNEKLFVVVRRISPGLVACNAD